MNHLALVAGMCAALSPLSPAQEQATRPNVLFIAVDDLNDWLGCMGGHPQAKTPNLDRLAKSSILFTNAHCAAPACNPSRTAIFTGRSPHRSGVYANGQKMREVLPKAELMPKTFARHGYWSAGSGKMLHYFIDARSWDEYFPEKTTENPFPRTLYPKRRPVSLPVGGPWQYKETDWAPLDATDEEFGGDWLVSQWVGKQLRRKHDKPFFLACGIYRPHEPWFVPKKYFEQFPLESVQLPPGYKASDLDDLPPSGKRAGPNRYFAHIRAHKQWRPAVQAYLASIAFADAMVGRVMDALEKGPNADNTIVVLWSDHGWHLGEKQHWQKFTAWRVCTRVPLMVRVPAGVPGLPAGTKPGVSTRPVNLLSLYPTLLQLCGLPPRRDNDGPSLVPLLEDPAAAWPHVSVTHLQTPGSFGLSAEGWRYIHYANGDEELYDTARDPYEWTNLAAVKEHATKLAELRARAPNEFAKKPRRRVASLPRLAWHPLVGKLSAPASKPDGKLFDVVFINRRKSPVSLFWMSRSGERKPYGEIVAGGQDRRSTRPGAVWMIADQGGKGLGYFKVGDRSSRAIVPDHRVLRDPQSRRRASLKETRPNILFIMSDDHTTQAFGCYGSRLAKLNPTPTLDQLAKGGMRFENVYCNNSICTPSRASIITGQYSQTNGVLDLLGKIEPANQHLALEMKKAGYHTAMIGKWHLKQEPASFDYYCVLPGQGKYFNPQFRIRGEKRWPKNVITERGKHSSTAITDKGLAWLEKGWDRTRPFFLMHHFKAPHDMFRNDKKYDSYLASVKIPEPSNLFHQPAKGQGSVATRGSGDSLVSVIGAGVTRRCDSWGLGKRLRVDQSLQEPEYGRRVYQKYLKRYLRCVKGVDDNVKRLVDYLKAEKLFDNTVIIYTGDQGFFLGEHDLMDKRWMYEEAFRMPFIVHYPPMIKKGSVNRWLINNTDFAPMMLELAGVKTPAYMQGRSFVRALRGEAKPDDWRTTTYYRYWMHMAHELGTPAHFGVRSGKYKLIFFYGSDFAKVTGFAKRKRWGVKKNADMNRFAANTPVAWEFYDLTKDPQEMKNEYANPEYQEVIKSLKAELKKQREDLNETDRDYPHLQKIIEAHWNDS